MSMKRFSSFLVVLLICFAAIAAPSRRNIVTVNQSDGTSLNVVLQGDERLHYYATADDGVVVTQGEHGCFYYAALTDEGHLQPTGRLAHNEPQRSAEERALLLQLNSVEMPAKMAERSAAKGRVRQAAGQTQVPNNGGVRIPVILVQFQDVKFREGEEAKQKYEQRMNGVNYKGDGGYGSVKDYFVAQSDSLFMPQFDVIGPITTDNKMQYYGENDQTGSDKRVGEMIEEACRKAKTAGFVDDFSVYDNDGDKEVDVVYIIYAGFGEAVTGADPNTVWPHQWELASAIGRSLTLDEVKLNKYACNNELFGTTSMDYGIDGIGTFCHEFSHCLGLPDFYDTRGSNFGMDVWSVMDYGCYNNMGKTPCNYTAYEREFMGWMPIQTVSGTTSVTLGELHETKMAYRVYNEADKTGNEYFIFENRQRVGWDGYLNGHGMLLIQVDYKASDWLNNTVNVVAKRQRMRFIPADSTYVATGSSYAGDLFPGSAAAVSRDLEPYTYNKPGTGEGKWVASINNIKEEKEIITMDFNIESSGIERVAVGGEAFSYYSDKEGLVISVAEDTEACIYTIEGKAIRTVRLSGGENRVSLAKGIYIVRVGNSLYKLIV